MRVTDSLIINDLNSDVNTSSSNYQALEQELSSGKQINQPSDNPAGTEQALTLNTALANIAQQQTNATAANSFLSYTDTQLSSVQTLAQQARTIAVAAASGGTQTPSSLQAYAAQVDSIIQQVVTVGNSQLGGRYIFAGTQTKTAPYQQNDPTHQYSGNAGSLTATIGNNSVITLNTPGSQVISPLLQNLETLKSDITNGDSDAISNTDLSNLDASLDTVSQAQASVGSATDQVTAVTTQLQQSQAAFNNTLNSIENVDLATVYTNLQSAQNVYQASLVATQGAFKFSLAQYIQ